MLLRLLVVIVAVGFPLISVWLEFELNPVFVIDPYPPMPSLTRPDGCFTLLINRSLAVTEFASLRRLGTRYDKRSYFGRSDVDPNERRFFYPPGY